MKRKPLKNNQDNMEEDGRHLPFQPPQYNFPINQSINQLISKLALRFHKFLKIYSKTVTN